MKKLFYLHIVFFLSLNITALPQNAEWIVYNTTNSELPSNIVTSIAIDNYGNKWVGTNAGLVKFNGMGWKLYNTLNSGLPNNRIENVVIDNLDNKWIVSGFSRYKNKVLMFDGMNWTFFNSSNSLIPEDGIGCLAVDNIGNKWFGYSYGLLKYNDTDWTIYNASNSGLRGSYVECIAVDESNNKWMIGPEYQNFGLVKFDDLSWTIYEEPISHQDDHWNMVVDKNGYKWIGMNGPWYPTDIGLLVFDNKEWTAYDTSNSGLPSNNIYCLAIDSVDNKWIGTSEGLAKFDGTNWIVYDQNNSGLPSNFISSIAVDKLGNKWVGTIGGLAVFNEAGIVSVEDETIALKLQPIDYVLFQNYPNPFNPTTTIRYSIPQSSNIVIKVFDILGKKIETLVNTLKPAGNYEVTWNAVNLPSGIYFYQLRAGSFTDTKKMVLLK